MIPKINLSLPKLMVIGVLVVGGGGLAYQHLSAKSAADAAPALIVPEQFSSQAQAGNLAYNATCAQCHGVNGVGTDKGPPFVHPIYNPGHHGDAAFFYAAHNGVKQHHWKFGDMPAQPQIKDEDLADIVAYVRELQVANGIVFQEHRM